MPILLLATTNPGKIREYRLLLDGLGYQITTLAEQGIAQVITEAGNSYEQNARLKAISYAKLSQLTTIADDSGLEVSALGGKPGIHSARFAGEHSTDTDKIKNLLTRLDGIPWEKRTACFKCAIAIATPEGQSELCHGQCCGIIAFEAIGQRGFGYDPIFYLPDMSKTMAELPLKEKNKISHRARACQKVGQILERFYNQTH